MKEKICKICKQLKPINFFNGCGSKCKECNLLQISEKIAELNKMGITPQIKCIKCNLEKIYTDFLKHPFGKLGRSKICLLCKKSYNEKRATAFEIKNKNFNIEESFCVKCNKIKSVENFNINKRIKRVCEKTCRECLKSRQKIIKIEKPCSICKEIKDINKFHTSLIHLDGKSPACKKCNNEKSKIRNQRVDVKKKNAENQIKRYRTNLNAKIKNLLRHRIFDALKRKNCKKNKRTADLIGCEIDFFLKYLESLFEPSMSWNNHGKYGWHMDHIIPCNLFDLTKEDEQQKCFHYTNLMPRWATTEIAESYGSNQIGNLEKHDFILNEYAHLV